MSNSMGLTIPTASQTPGPDYANEVNADLTLVAEHDHTSGKGVQVPAAGLNINTDLPFGSNDATELRSARFTEQSAPLAAGTDVGCVSDVLGDLYWNNGDGVPVKITDGDALNASAIGGFTGLAGTTGAATYASGPGSFEFTSSPGVPATVKVGPLVSENAAGRQVTISPPAGTGNYGLTLPTGLPGSGTKFVRVSSAGVMTDDVEVDGSTIEISSSTMRVKDSGIVTAKIADANVTRAKLVAVGQQLSGEVSSGALTSTSYASVSGLAVTLVTTGRPVVIALVPRATAGGEIRVTETNGSSGIRTANLALTDNAGSEFAIQTFGGTLQSNAQLQFMPGAFFYFYVPAAGSHTLQLRYLVAPNTSLIVNGVLIAYEL
jgi:hypothetical protein